MNILRSHLLFILISFFFPAFLIFAGAISIRAEEETSIQQKALEVQNFYKKLTSIKFDFTQTSQVGGRERSGSGDAIFVRLDDLGSKRSIMRWNYTEPDKQIIISDGTTLTLYTDKDKQLIKTSAQELESDITYAFFAGNRDLLDDFEAHHADNNYSFSSSVSLQAIKLIPRKPHNQIKEVVVWFNDKNIIHHMLIRDHFDAVTELHFENIKLNSIPVADQKTIKNILNFPIPPGTEIITQ